jgi:hypothetical protein
VSPVLRCNLPLPKGSQITDGRASSSAIEMYGVRTTDWLMGLWFSVPAAIAEIGTTTASMRLSKERESIDDVNFVRALIAPGPAHDNLQAPSQAEPAVRRCSILTWA